MSSSRKNRGQLFASLLISMVMLNACSKTESGFYPKDCKWDDPANLTMECIKGLRAENCSQSKLAEMFPETKDSTPVIEQLFGTSHLNPDGSYTVNGSTDVKDENGQITKKEWQCTTPEFDDQKEECPTTCNLL